MKNQLQPLLAAVLLSGAASLGLSSQSFGADVAEETDEQPVEAFYLHGFIEVGGLVFIDRPAAGERSKFEEYGEVSPGFIVPEVYLEFGSIDGLNLVEFRGTDLTWNDRNVTVDYSRAGQLYVSGEYDETPHVDRSRALTIFDGVGTDTLTVNDILQANLAGGGAPVATDFRPMELSVDRKTGKAALRYTPTPQWDINLNYSMEKREGTQVLGACGVTSSCFGSGTSEIPAPVDYTTQNFGASIQYLADLGNGRKWITNLAYAGSIFENANDSVTWDAPFAPPLDIGRHGLPPDNYAHRVTLNTAADLAEKTRFTGTVSYNMMRQDEMFLPWSTDPLLNSNPGLGFDPTGKSLHGEMNTLTVNTKLTTRALHPDVTVSGSYRYYLADSDTPDILFDGTPARIRVDNSTNNTVRVSLHPGYAKQNADIDTVWRANDWATLGLLLGWEQYDRDIGREADVTDEFSAKVTADLTPVDWLSVRTSALYAERRFDNYDYVNRVGQPSHNDTDDGDQDPLMRKYDMSDRDRIKLNVSAEATVSDGLTITGLGGYRDDEFGDNFGPSEIGLMHDRSWDAGVELNYMADERISLFASYTREEFDRRIRNNDFTGLDADIDEAVDTVMAGVDVVLVPDALDLKLGYTYARGVEEWKDASAPPFPDVKNNFQSFDASLKYTFNEDQKRRFGWTGNAVAKFAYAYERNRVTNWANVVTPYTSGSSIWMAGMDPNYDAQIAYGTLKLEW